MCAAFTDSDAFTASGTILGHIKYLRRRGLGFGIMTPLAAQGAAFQENCRPYSRSVLCAESLDLGNRKDHGFFFVHLHLSYPLSSTFDYHILPFPAQRYKSCIPA